MPIYEYRCDSCGHELEKLQRMNDPRLVDCPKCGDPALRRLVSAAGFRLKGAGWYETDFKKDNQRNLAEGSKKPAEGRDTFGATSGDSGADKPAAKADSKKADAPAAKTGTSKKDSGAA